VMAHEPVPLGEAVRTAIQTMARDLPALWRAPGTTNADRQAVVRQCVDGVVVTLIGNTEQVEMDVQWSGGARTAITLIRPVGSLAQLSYYPALLQRATELRAAGETITVIADRLTEDGWRPVQGTGTWTANKARRLLAHAETSSERPPRRRISDGIPRQTHEWTPRELADQLEMTRDSLNNWIQKRAVRGRKVTYHGRSLWLVWADEAELARLREKRDFPHYGPVSRRVDAMSSDVVLETTVEKVDIQAHSACQNADQDV